jgi:hypothetical protein
MYLPYDRAVREGFYTVLKFWGDSVYLIKNVSFPANK